MGKIESNSGYSNRRYHKPNFVMTTSELVALDKELEKYKYKKFSNYWNEELNLVDEQQWLKDNGGLNKDSAVIITGLVHAEYSENGKLLVPQDCNPIRFEYLQEKLRQWTDWEAKREYAKKMELKSHTESLAKSMKV